MRAVLREDADHRRAEKTSEDHERDRDPVDRHVDVMGEVVDAGVRDLDRHLSVTKLVQHVVHLPRNLEGNLAELLHLPLGTEREAPRREAVGDQLSAYGRATSKTLKSG